MATWRAQIKVGNSGTPFDVEVVAGSTGTATETINTIYSPVWIRNLRMVSSRNQSSSISNTTSVSSGMYWFVGFVFVLYLIVTYWYYILPIGLILGILWIWAKHSS